MARTRGNRRILLKNFSHTFEWTKRCITDGVRDTVVRTCPTSFRPHEIIFPVTIKHEWSLYITIRSYFLVNGAIIERNQTSEIFFQLGNGAMPPSTIDKIVCAVAVSKRELIDRLRTIMKSCNEWMTEMIMKGTSRV